ncbi:hypothetical protein B0H16DRAFT_1740492 [Mycena metata]|uniref:Uncharacterized protein n=1 Tax=Mycena metata TaxID=1033252 RepID=A0AAD7MHX3_9AGAR|nr:hypothetical protein B0H16DRAFT_1740492 [Mycena metata]
MTPDSRLYNAVRKLSPKSGRGLIKAFGTLKRTREEDKGGAERIPLKKRRDEVDIPVGSRLPIVFHQFIRELYSNKIYIPLSVFTSPSLIHQRAHPPTMEKIKLNTASSADKPLCVLDTAAFESNCLAEKDLDPSLRRWSEKPDHWNAHFGFLEDQDNAKSIFPAILITDIKIRKRYAALPFKFSHELYRNDLNEEVQALKLAHGIMSDGGSVAEYMGGVRGIRQRQRRRLLIDGGPRCSRLGVARQRQRGAGQRGRGDGARGGAPTPRGGAPFLAGNVGAASPVVCLICAKRGHMYNACTSTAFADGSALTCALHGREISNPRSGKTLCRNWNTKGNAAGCAHDGARVHACSLCGNKNHYVFSWTCRQNPPL